MNNQRFALAAVTLGMVGLMATGCILGGDPNKNSQIFGGLGGSTGGGLGGAGGPGGAAGGGSIATTPITGSAVATFDTGLEGFTLSTFADPRQNNLNDPTNPLNAGKATPTMEFDPAVGSPSGGSIKLAVPYFGASQYGEVRKNYDPSSPQNWKNKTVHLRVRATTGSFHGGVQMYAKTGTGFVYGSAYTNFGTSTDWQEFTLNLASVTVSGFDASQVVEFGAQINSSSTGTAQQPVTFNIDSFSVDPPFPVVDAGPETGATTDSAADTAAPADGGATDGAPADAATGN